MEETVVMTPSLKEQAYNLIIANEKLRAQIDANQKKINQLVNEIENKETPE
jgi:hypothetical protein